MKVWEFYDACALGDEDGVCDFLSQRRPSEDDLAGGFDTACQAGHANVALLILGVANECGIDLPSDQTQQALVRACSNGHTAVLRLLLGLSGTSCVPLADVHDSNETAFVLACDSGSIDSVKLLLGLQGDQRVDVHTDGGELGFVAACRSGHTDTVQLLLSLRGDRRIDVHAGEEMAFIAACRGGRTQVVRELLCLEGDRRIDVHARRERAFVGACGGGHATLVQLLLDLDDDRRIDVHAGGDEGFVDACKGGHAEVVQQLLDLPPERGFSWNTPGQEDVLLQCLELQLAARERSVAKLLVREAPLPSRWLDVMVRFRTRAPPPLPAIPLSAHEVSIAQQVTLWALDLQASDPHCAWHKHHGVNASLDVLAMCSVLLPHCGATVQDALQRKLGMAWCGLLGYLQQLVWRGIRIPLVPAPGVHLLTAAQAGGLGRPGRRGLLLHRAAARATSAKHKTRRTARQ